MFITDEDYKVVIGEQALRVISQVSTENRANAETEAVEEISGYLRPKYDTVEGKLETEWFKVKVAFLAFDEKTMKEKETKMVYLVQADKAETAQNYTNEALGQGMQDYRIISNVETKIMDVYQHE